MWFYRKSRSISIVGKLAKTDKIDARVIAQFGKLTRPRAVAKTKELQGELDQLVTRRRQLIATRTAEKNRQGQTASKVVRKSIQRVLDAINKDIKTIDREITKLVQSDDDWRNRAELLGTNATCLMDGQSCVAGSRLYLHADIADEFLERMQKVASSIKIGDPASGETEMGPLCTAGQLETIEREVAHAVGEGARVLSGGKRPDGMSGLFYEPTIIDCPRQDLRIVDTELFGPVLSVQRFRDEDEVIRLANDTRHGLAAGIFTRDSARSIRVARAIRAGIVWVNTYRVISPIAEFGGVKGSGYGREGGFQAMLDYTRPKTIWMNTSDAPVASPFQPR